MVPSRPRRLRGFSYVGRYRYSLTFCAADRHEAFTAPVIVAELRRQLLRTAAEYRFDVTAYCFMPDHLHLLVEGLSSRAALLPFCKVVRMRLACDYSTRAGRSLWQRGYWERVLREDEETETYARYIFGNPIRKGLVQSFRAYPFSGGTWFDRMD